MPKSRKPKKSKKIKPVPTNKKLYAQVKRDAKKKFKAWPSAYASAWLVKEYKRRGGKYSGKIDKSQGLSRWFDEEWINVCKLPKIVKCGRPKTSLKDWKKKYPYCRPRKKISKSTPKIASSLSKAEIKRRCKNKRRNPRKRITDKKSRKPKKSRKVKKS